MISGDLGRDIGGREHILALKGELLAIQRSNVVSRVIFFTVKAKLIERAAAEKAKVTMEDSAEANKVSSHDMRKLPDS